MDTQSHSLCKTKIFVDKNSESKNPELPIGSMANLKVDPSAPRVQPRLASTSTRPLQKEQVSSLLHACSSAVGSESTYSAQINKTCLNTRRKYPPHSQINRPLPDVPLIDKIDGRKDLTEKSFQETSLLKKGFQNPHLPITTEKPCGLPLRSGAAPLRTEKPCGLPLRSGAAPLRTGLPLESIDERACTNEISYQKPPPLPKERPSKQSPVSTEETKQKNIKKGHLSFLRVLPKKMFFKSHSFDDSTLTNKVESKTPEKKQRFRRSESLDTEMTKNQSMHPLGSFEAARDLPPIPLREGKEAPLYETIPADSEYLSVIPESENLPVLEAERSLEPTSPERKESPLTESAYLTVLEAERALEPTSPERKESLFTNAERWEIENALRIFKSHQEGEEDLEELIYTKSSRKQKDCSLSETVITTQNFFICIREEKKFQNDSGKNKMISHQEKRIIKWKNNDQKKPVVQRLKYEKDN